MNDKLLQLKMLAEKATQGPWEAEVHFTQDFSKATDYERFQATGPTHYLKESAAADARYLAFANPKTVLKMIEIISDMKVGLEIQSLNRNHTCNIEYGNCTGVENCLKCKANTLLNRVDESLEGL
jgi:hypothetical protein